MFVRGARVRAVRDGRARDDARAQGVAWGQDSVHPQQGVSRRGHDGGQAGEALHGCHAADVDAPAAGLFRAVGALARGEPDALEALLAWEALALKLATACVPSEGKWKVSGPDLNGDALTAVVALEAGVIVVTVF